LRQVGSAVKQLARLGERLEQRRADIDGALRAVTGVCSAAAAIAATIDALDSDMDDFKPVAADINVISQQQNHMKVRAAIAMHCAGRCLMSRATHDSSCYKQYYFY
jgi:ABC-type transporter Mla subunit MlaD